MRCFSSFNRTMQIRFLNQLKLNSIANFSFWAAGTYDSLNMLISSSIHSSKFINYSLSLFSFLLIFPPEIVIFQISTVSWNNVNLLGFLPYETSGSLLTLIFVCLFKRRCEWDQRSQLQYVDLVKRHNERHNFFWDEIKEASSDLQNMLEKKHLWK